MIGPRCMARDFYELLREDLERLSSAIESSIDPDSDSVAASAAPELFSFGGGAGMGGEIYFRGAKVKNVREARRKICAF